MATTEIDVNAKMAKIKKMVLVGAVFAVVGYLMIIGALVLELTQFHPAIENYFTAYTGHSLAGGGADRAGQAGLNAALAEIHKFPSTLLWLKLGGIGHILVGIFMVLAGIIQALALMPVRLGNTLQEAGVGGEATPGASGGAAPADDD